MLCSQCRRIALRAAARSSRLRQLTTSSTPVSLPSIPTTHLLRNPSSSRPSTLRLSQNNARSGARYSSTTTPVTPTKPDYLDKEESQIWDKLAAEFSPTELSVKDISGGCGSMYAIEIASEKFRGATMLKQQRQVNAILGDQMKSWHGVQLRTKVPQP